MQISPDAFIKDLVSNHGGDKELSKVLRGIIKQHLIGKKNPYKTILKTFNIPASIIAL